MIKSAQERLKKIVALWNTLQAQIRERGITKKSLLQDEFLQWAVTTPLYNIGEQVYAFSPALKDTHPEVMQSVVSGLRHRLVHDYEGINWSMIVEAVFEEMDGFVKAIEPLVQSE